MEVNLIPTLESDELLLRPWFPEFADDYLRIFGDKEVTDSCGIAPINTISDARAKLRAFAKSKRTEWSIALKNGGTPIIVGTIGICEVISIREYSNVKELGYGLGKEYWGQGIMPKAIAVVEKYCFEDLESEAVIVRIVGGNTRSERTAEKCGYRYYSQKKIGTEYKKTYVKVFVNNVREGLI